MNILQRIVDILFLLALLDNIWNWNSYLNNTNLQACSITVSISCVHAVASSSHLHVSLSGRATINFVLLWLTYVRPCKHDSLSSVISSSSCSYSTARRLPAVSLLGSLARALGQVFLLISSDGRCHADDQVAERVLFYRSCLVFRRPRSIETPGTGGEDDLALASCQ